MQKIIELYNPKMFKSDDEIITESISNISQTIDDQYKQDFLQLLNLSLLEANEQKDIEVTEAHEKIIKLIPQQINKDLFEVLSILCYQSLVSCIDKVLQPASIISQKLEPEVIEQFLRYLNNWFGQLVGMKDCRENLEKYLLFLNTHLESHALGVLRIYLQISRVITLDLQKQFNFVDQLIKISDFVQTLNKDDKLYKTASNIICGSIGRVLLTVKKFDVSQFNLLAIAVKKIFSPYVDNNLPCSADLQHLISWKIVQDDSDMY